MLKQIKTTWRPLIELTEVQIIPASKEGASDQLVETGNKYHMNVLDVPHIISNPNFTALIYDHHTILVKESAKDIYKTIDKMVKDEQDRKAQQAHEYFEATQKRVAETGKVVQMPANDGGDVA